MDAAILKADISIILVENFGRTVETVLPFLYGLYYLWFGNNKNILQVYRENYIIIVTKGVLGLHIGNITIDKTKSLWYFIMI